MRSRRVATIVASVMVLSAALAGGVIAGAGSSDEEALRPTRSAADRGIEQKVDRLVSKMTLDEKLQQIQLLSDGQMARTTGGGDRAAKAGVGGVFSLVDPDKINQLPARRGRAVAAAHPDPVRVRHDPRLPDDLPDPAGDGEQLRPERRADRRDDRRARVGDRRPQADLQPDGRRLARAALGPDLRGRAARTRTSAPSMAAARVKGAQGARLRGAGQGRHERQALRRVRPARGRARLQHDRHVRAAAAEPLPAAVQGRDRRRRRHRDVLVQRDQRRRRAARTTTRRPTSSRSEWGFDGFIESDYTAVAELRACPPKTPDDRARAATASPPTGRTRRAQALNAGTDSEMVSTNIRDYGKQLLAQRRISMQRLDDAVRRILRVKFRAGLFEHPYVDVGQGEGPEQLPHAGRPRGRALRRRALDGAAQERRRDLLPLSQTKKTVGDRAARQRTGTTCSVRGGAAARTTTP